MVELKVNFLQILNIAVLINGLIFCLLLLTKKENKKANRFLSLMIFSICYTVFTSFIIEFRLYDRYPELHLLPFSLTFVIGPAFYFYTRSLINPEFRFSGKHWWHFSLIILNYLHSIYHLIYGRHLPHPFIHNFTEALPSYALISVFIYLLISYRFVANYQKSIQNIISNTAHVQLNWVKQFIIILFSAFIILFIARFIDYKDLVDFSREAYQGYMFNYRDYLYLGISFTIFWLSIGGFYQSQIVHSKNNFPNSPDDGKDYSGIGSALVKFMDEKKLYLNPELNLAMLGAESNFSGKEISVTLNHHLKKNFYWFVNEYRVEEAKMRLSDPQNDHLTILTIAFDCGFNSKATFNRIFKKITGKNPKYFRTHS